MISQDVMNMLSTFAALTFYLTLHGCIWLSKLCKVTYYSDYTRYFWRASCGVGHSLNAPCAERCLFERLHHGPLRVALVERLCNAVS